MVIPINRPNYWNRWTTAKVKRATWLTRPTTCELCGKAIHKGQYYRDGGIHHRVHDACCIAARTV